MTMNQQKRCVNIFKNLPFSVFGTMTPNFFYTPNGDKNFFVFMINCN